VKTGEGVVQTVRREPATPTERLAYNPAEDPLTEVVGIEQFAGFVGKDECLVTEEIGAVAA